MFQFLQPILLFSFAAITIPVLIHLWNVRKGKTLKVGSITLLVLGSQQNARSLKLHDLLLLFLRCLLIALLACMLAQPLWQQQLSAKKEKGWILLEKKNLHESYNRFKPQIDSLLKSGYEFHYFNQGFDKDDLSKALQAQKDKLVSDTQLTTYNAQPETYHSPLTTHISYWSLLKELNEAVPSELPVVVFVQNNIERFKGDRPSVALNLHLQTYIPADTVSAFIANAFLTGSDSIGFLVGHSKPTETYYTQQSLPLISMSNPNYTVAINKGKLMVALRNTQTETNVDTSLVEIDTSVLRITVFTDRYRNDANYISAAIGSIKRFSKRRIELQVIGNYKELSPNQDWLFWLSEQNIPVQNAAKNMFLYEKGKAENVHSWIIEGDETNPDKPPVEITKSIAQKASNASVETFWSDGYGNALLSKEVKSNTSVYHFYTRLNPEWNDLPWSRKFPQLIFKLLFPGDKNDVALYDKRVVDERQAQPFLAAKNEIAVKDKFIQKIDFTHFVWITAFIVFLIERLISFKNKKIVKYG